MENIELIKRISEKYNLDYKQVEALAGVIFDEMSLALLNHEFIQLPKVGKFFIKTRPEKSTENRRGQDIRVKEKHVIHFKADLELRKKLNPKSRLSE
ncbi:hypothetical protein GCM10007938_42450 [Vibrio zhanjiangensis]|uniref:Integration host factor subunit alpha n=1 Tax=Vibrio zhanjiangensis TaxID=1046128 RepID=A0ABQ6F6I0_9VIBR|nr:HU family DNA-binding protein [Vibrio zhanjiangensis]GLT20460.1 hypothetical protein GCM10007938_42450 [Vibrio zhanjiangensis]